IPYLITKTTETRPDGSTRVVFSNFAAEVMLEAFTDVSSGLTYLSYYQYDPATGKLVLQANPSAVTGYDPNQPDLLVNQSGHYLYLADNGGLIQTWTYASATTANASTPGDAAYYFQQTALQHGQLGLGVLQGGVQYLARTGGPGGSGATIYVQATDT